MANHWNFDHLTESHAVTPADPDAEPEIDEARRNPKVAVALDAVRDMVGRLVREHGFTPAEITVGLHALLDMAVEDIVFAKHHLVSLIAPAWDPPDDADDGSTPRDAEGPVYYEGAPMVSNPGALPMRDDEPGIPLVLRGQVRSVHGEPLAGAELDVWLAGASGHYSNTGVRGIPAFNLRGRLFADDQGRYEVRAIKPVPYDFPVRPRTAVDMLLAQGYSLYRPRHIHVKVRHARLASEFTTQIYFRGDPYLRYYPSTPKQRRASDRLEVATVLHNAPDEIAAVGFAQPFATVDFDIVLPCRDDHEPVTPQRRIVGPTGDSVARALD